MKKLKFLGLVFLTLALVVGVGVSSANAALTLEALTITSSGALTLEGAAASVITVGALNTGGIAIGNGATIKTISLGAGNAVNTIKIGDNATPVNVITIGGALSSLALTDADWSITSPGVATFASVNKLTLTAPATSATLTLAQGSSLITSGAFAATLTSTATTNVTLPTTGTLATLAGAETLSGKTLTAPKIANAGFIADASGNELVIFTTTASAINEVTFANAATGNNPSLTMSGGDTNVGLNLVLKAAGGLAVSSSTATSDSIMIAPYNTAGAAFTGIITSADITGANKTWTFPDATGTVSLVTGTETLTNKTLTAPVINGAVTTTGLTLPAFTVGATITGSGALTIATTGATALGLDAGGAAAINVGATNATGINIGRTGQLVTFPGNVTVTGTFSPAVTSAASFAVTNLTNQLVLGTTPNLVTINSPAPAGAVTLTLPNTTDTLVGRATTDTLTNKTLTSPVMTAPALGTATATSVNKVALTAPATSATLTIIDGKTLTASDTTNLTTNGITFAGTETLALTATKSVAFADAFSTVGANPLILTTGASTNVTLPATGTLATLAGTESLSNKTFVAPVLGAATGTSLAATGAITSSSPSTGIGYVAGAGCAGIQATSRTTAIACAGNSGSLTLFSAAGSATPASFTVTNASVAATDTIIVNQKSGTDIYSMFVTAVGAGSFRITFFNSAGTTTETPVFNFAVLKAVAS